MTTRKIPKIDPVQVAALALKRIKTNADYSRIVAANTAADIDAAWAMLTTEEQSHVKNICGQAASSGFAIAQELAGCETLIQLQAVKATHGEDVVKSAWKLIAPEERLRLKGICQNQQREELQPVTEQPEETGAYTQDLTERWSQEQAQPQTQPKRTLFSISDDLQRLNDLLDEVGDDAQQQELIAQWFETLGEERDRKLDGYAALISEMQTRAEVRKAEARRLMELAASDENRARLLKNRLKYFFETHNLKTVETPRYKLQLQRNGGKAPLILDDSIPVTQLPERFQKVSIDADTTAIRAALDAGESLEWARLGERGESMRIK